MAVSDAVFNALDVNQDGVLDQNEFSQLAGGVAVGSASGYETYGTSGLVGGYGGYGGYSGYSGYDTSLGYANGGYGYGSASAYESSGAYNGGAYAASAGTVYDGSVLMVVHQLFKPMQLMLKVSIKILTQQSFVVQHQLVFKPTHKTFVYDSFNHLQYHPMVYVIFFLSDLI